MLNRLASALLIRQSEYAQVAFFFALFFTIGAGMALGRGTTDALFFKRYGIEYLPVMYMLTAGLLSAVAVLYAAFVDMIPAERFFRILFGVLGALLVANWSAITFGGSDLVYPAYYLLYEIASELLLVHSFLYLGQNLVQTQSKRLVPVVLAGHQIGVICGGLVLAGTSHLIGVQNILLIWALLLALGVAMLGAWHRRRGVSPYFRAGRKERSRLRQSVNQVRQGVRLLGGSPLLMSSAIALFFMVISTYVLCYTVNLIYTDTFRTEEALGAFFGVLTAVNSAVALLLQVFVTNRAVRRFGVRAVNLIFPGTSLLSFAALALSFSLPAAIVGSVNKDTLMPAFRNPVRNVFMDALPMHIQGRARAMSIVLVMPLALLAAGIFLAGVQGTDNRFLLLGLGMAAAAGYLYFNHRMNGAYVREIVSNLKERLFVPEQQMRDLALGGGDAIAEIERGVRHSDDEISLAYARVLSRSAPERAAELIPRRMDTAGLPARDQLVRLLRPLNAPGLRDRLRRELGRHDEHFDATVYRALFEAGDPQVRDRVPSLLAGEAPRLQAAGVYGALLGGMEDLRAQALETWAALLRDRSPERCVAGVELIGPQLGGHVASEPLRSACLDGLGRLLHSPQPRLVRVALETLQRRPDLARADALGAVLPALLRHSDWRLRRAALGCARLLSEDEAEALLWTGIDDPHPEVRAAAVEALESARPEPAVYLHSCLTGGQAGSPRARETLIGRMSDSGAPAQTMLEVSLAHAREANLLHRARGALLRLAPRGTAAVDLLAGTLEERSHQLVDLALRALQSSEHDQDIAVIRAGLRSGDPRHFASACELLSNLGRPELAAQILPVFEDDPSATRGRDAHPAFASLESLLAWGRGLSDPWLRECMDYASEALSGR